MNFAYPGLLYGLLLGLIPIIVYYLMRFRALRVPWGADYILERALARRRRKLYLDQIILLALRALVVMALVTAFARPQSRTAHGTETGGEVLRILLVDGSYSMLAGEGSQSRRDTAVEAMRGLVSSWTRGEQWSLYMLDSHPRWIVDRASVVNASQSLAILNALEYEECAVSIASGLEAVLAHEAGQSREIYIFTDDQATNWKGADSVIAEIDDNTRLFWINPTLEDHRNLAVTDLQLGHERVLRGYPFSVYAQVQNFSVESVRDADLTFLANGAMIGSERVSLPPGQNARVRMELRLDELGPQVITARLSRDALTVDNAMSAGVEVVDSVSLLVLRDAERTDKFETSAGFLGLIARVLAGGAGKEAQGPLRVTEHAEPGCDLSLLMAYDAVVLDGGRTLTPALAETLRQYVVENGGGLILAMDDTVDLPVWCQQLGPAQLLPALPVRVHNEPIAGDAFRRLSRSGFDLPGLRDLETDADGDITQLQFFTWVEFESPIPGTGVLARFSDGSPYAMQYRFDRGSVLVLAAGLSSRNNNLLVRETVYPFLVHLFVEAASSGQYTRRVGLHEPVRLLVKGDPPPIAVQFGLEGQEPVLATLTPHAQGTYVEYTAGADRSGPASLLVLRETSRERVWIGVQGERSDSDLTSIPADYRTRLTERFHLTEVASAKELSEALASSGQGVERYAWVLMAVLLFGMGEMLMGLRFV